MSSWRLPVDLLAHSRFVLSPLAETVGALTVLDAPVGPSERAFHTANRAAYDSMLREHPKRRAIAERCWWPRRGSRQGWMADFLAVPPLGDDATFADELDALADGLDDDAIRSALLGGGRPHKLLRELARPGVRDAALGLLRWIWTATVESDWPRRSRILRADIVARTATLATRGWAGVLPGLGKHREWLGEGRLRITSYDLPDHDLGTAEALDFVPVHVSGSWTCCDLATRTRYAVIYPVTGALAPVHSSAHGLARLIGTNRAEVLALLDEPRSTTAVAALAGLPIGSVGNHLRVLLDAGAVLRRRSGREVLYWRTALGDELIAAGGSPADR